MNNMYRRGMIYRILWLIICAQMLSGCISATSLPPVEPSPTVNDILILRFEENGLIVKESARGITVFLPSTFFIVGSAGLSESAKDKIRFIAEISNENFVLDRQILVEGHTDSTGSESFNTELSKKRAEGVKAQLIEYGLSHKRVNANWFGELRPLVPNLFSDGTANPDAQSANRRVEFVILNPLSS